MSTRRIKNSNSAQNDNLWHDVEPEFQLMIEKEVGRVLLTSRFAREEKDELKAWAWMGFLEAKKRFDPRQGYEFSAFARQRVRGAIYDGLAKINPMGQSGTRVVKRILKGIDIEQLDGDGQTTTQKKKINNLDPTTEAEMSFSTCYRRVYFQALSIWTEHLSQSLIELDPSKPLEDSDEKQQAQNLLSLAFEKLTLEEQELMIAIYDLRRTGDHGSAFANRKGVHRSTISRKHSQILAKLRNLVSIQGEELHISHSKIKAID